MNCGILPENKRKQNSTVKHNKRAHKFGKTSFSVLCIKLFYEAILLECKYELNVFSCMIESTKRYSCRIYVTFWHEIR